MIYMYFGLHCVNNSGQVSGQIALNDNLSGQRTVVSDTTTSKYTGKSLYAYFYISLLKKFIISLNKSVKIADHGGGGLINKSKNSCLLKLV